MKANKCIIVIRNRQHVVQIIATFLFCVFFFYHTHTHVIFHTVNIIFHAVLGCGVLFHNFLWSQIFIFLVFAKKKWKIYVQYKLHTKRKLHVLLHIHNMYYFIHNLARNIISVALGCIDKKIVSFFEFILENIFILNHEIPLIFFFCNKNIIIMSL